jgi:predicted MarR family transcription regulator
MRRHLLTEQSKIIGQVDQKLAEATKLINLMTGLYDEASRTSATYGVLHLAAETGAVGE